MFLLVSEHVVPIQISINLGNTFLRISSIRKIVVAWILARVFAYLPSFFSQILDSIYWTVLIFYFDLLWMVWHWKPAIANDGETESLHFLSNKGRKSIGSIWLGVRGHFTKKHDLYGSREIKNAIFKSWINSAESECYIDQGTCFLEAKRFWGIKRLNEERFREAEIAMERFFFRNIS